MGTWWQATVGATTGRGRAMTVLGVALVSAGLVWRYPLVSGVGGCLVLVVLAELLALALAAKVEASRRVEPAVVVRHGLCSGHLTVHGHRRRGLIRLDVADRVGGSLVPITLPDRTGEHTGTTEVVYPVPTPRRGLIDVGPVQVRLSGLTGMVARSVTTGSVDQVRVLPRPVPLAAMLRGHRRAAVGDTMSREFGGTDITGLHEYVPGDDLRRLHWATTARTGTLMVREDAEPSEPHVSVILDDRAASYLGDLDLFEESVEIAAAICRRTAEDGNPVRLTTASGQHDVEVPGSVVRQPRREQQDLEFLFADIDLAPLAAPAGAIPRGGDIVVAVTGPAADPRELALALGTAPTRVLCVVDPSPLVSAHQEAGVLVLRGQTSSALARLWDEAALA